jgi:hypothetical protein
VGDDLPAGGPVEVIKVIAAEVVVEDDRLGKIRADTVVYVQLRVIARLVEYGSEPPLRAPMRLPMSV